MHTHPLPKRRKLFLQNEKTCPNLHLKHDDSVNRRVAQNNTSSKPQSDTCCCCYRLSLPSILQPCARCDQLVCRVCTRTCEGGPSSYGSDSLQSIKPLNKPPIAPRKIRPMKRARKFNSLETISTQIARRRPRVDDENSDHQQREPGLSTISGCKRTICRKCTVEDPMSHLTVCQDCHTVLPKPLGATTFEDADMTEA